MLGYDPPTGAIFDLGGQDPLSTQWTSLCNLFAASLTKRMSIRAHNEESHVAFQTDLTFHIVHSLSLAFIGLLYKNGQFLVCL